MQVAFVRFRIWMAMLAVAFSAIVMVEFRQRRERLTRLCVSQLERANACLDRAGRICKQGETPQSIDSSYRRRGPRIWQDYQDALNHLTLNEQYNGAASRMWMPMLSNYLRSMFSAIFAPSLSGRWRRF